MTKVEELTALYNGMSQINTSGQSTIIMAGCLESVQHMIQREIMEEKINKTSEKKEVEK